VDRAEFVPLARARELIHPEQAVFLDRLLEYLQKREPASL
jgi:predicted NUDIX family NTP pyrophosphohydrolase